MVTFKQYFRSFLLGSLAMALVLTIAGYLPNAATLGRPGLLVRAWAGMALWSGFAVGLMFCGQKACPQERFAYPATVPVLMVLWALFAGAHALYGVSAESSGTLRLGLLALAISVGWTKIEGVVLCFTLLYKAAFGTKPPAL